MIKLEQTVRDPWCTALDSSLYTQTTGTLKSADDGGYCCLGVFAEVQGATAVAQYDDEATDDEGNPIEAIRRYDFTRNGEDVNDDDLLDEDFAAQYGLTTDHQNFFSALNDGSHFVAYKQEGHPTAPFYPIMEAIAAEVDDKGLCVHCAPGGITRTDTSLSITFRKHSFSEISAILKAYF